MHQAFAILILAIVAGLTSAAPTPSRTLTKRSFKVPVKGHGKRTPEKALAHGFYKHGWEMNFAEYCSPWEALASALASGQQGNYGSSPWDVQSSAVWQIYGSSIVFAFPSSTAPPSASASGFVSQAPVWPTSSAPAQIPSSSAVASAPASSAPAPSGPAPSGPAPSGPAPSAPAASPSSSVAASAPAPSASAPSSGGSDEGEVSATPDENEASYISPVSIGGQKLNLDFDTGSSDLWVYNSGMPSSETQGHDVFNPSKSSTFTKYPGGSWKIQYGDGSTASGDVGFDQVEIGGVVAKKQAIELAEQVSGSFLQDDFMDGLLGLAFSSINQVEPQQQKTFFENVMNELDQPLFTADLEEDASGTYEFGSIDSSKYTGDIHYTAVDNSNGFWQFQSETYTIGGQSHSCGTCSPTIADTGTSLLIWDNDVVEAYYKQVQGAQLSSQGYVYPCSAKLPDLGIAIGSGYTAVVKGSDMTYADAGQGLCFGGIQPNQGNGINIVGDVLLKQFFAVFDGGKMQFGIAEKP